MIVVQITGGLGNQMFQYAAGRALSLKNNTDLILDIQHFDDIDEKEDLINRDFELGVFDFDKKVRKNPFLYYLKPNSSLFLNLYYWIKKKVTNFSFFYEGNLEYKNEFQFLGKNVYLQGYFQSEKYFKDYREELLSDFIFPADLNSENKEVLNLINENNAVSIHIRRGDYVNNKLTNTVHGVLPKSYYEQAIEIILSKVKEPYFFIFSDDPEWVMENFKLEVPFEIIAHNQGDQSYIDMQLMSCCDHNIIANSSFSWWGAWLNNNPEKIVIGANNWFLDPGKQKNNIMCSNWIKI
jgi:hypothetical protein